MDLENIRGWVVADSGRYDLVNADGSDNGMDKFIRAATRWLDRKTEVFRQIGRVYRTLSAGAFYTQFRYARTITKVGIHTTSKFKGYLDRYELDALKSLEDTGYDDPFGSVTAGTPTKYAPVFLRAVDTDSWDYSGYEDWINTIDMYIDYNGIIVAPKADQEYLLEVWGKFFSNELTNNSDNNYWSVLEPSILVMAVLRQLEIFHRNRQGALDWETAIMNELSGMELDFVEDSITDITQLEG